MDGSDGSNEQKVRDDILLERKRHKRAQKIVKLLPPSNFSYLLRVVHYLVALAIAFEWNIHGLNENQSTTVIQNKRDIWLLYVIPRPVLWDTYPSTVKLWKLASSLIHKHEDDDRSFSDNPPLRLIYKLIRGTNREIEQFKSVKL